MPARRQLDPGLGLPGAEMQVRLVVRYGFVHWRKIDIDQQMVMSGIGLGDTGGCDAHIRGETHAHPKRTMYSGIVIWPDYSAHGARRSGFLIGGQYTPANQDHGCRQTERK